MRNLQPKNLLISSTFHSCPTKVSNSMRCESWLYGICLHLLAGLLCILLGLQTASSGEPENLRPAEYRSISDGEIPPEVRQEISLLRQRYLSLGVRSYHDGDCIAERFLEERLARGMSVPEDRILRDIEGECVDPPAVYRESSTSCLTTMLPMSPQSRRHLTDRQVEGHCHCVGTFTKERYSASPVFNRRAIALLRVEASEHCHRSGPHEPPIDAARTSDTPDRQSSEAGSTVGVETGSKQDAFEESSSRSTNENSAEAEWVKTDCERKDMYSSFHDCDCLTDLFLEERTARGPTVDRYTILGDIGSNCVDSRGVAEHSYNYCMNHHIGSIALYGSPIPPGGTTDDPELEKLCKCVGETMALEYSQSPDPNSRVISRLRVDSVRACNP